MPNRPAREPYHNRPQHGPRNVQPGEEYRRHARRATTQRDGNSQSVQKSRDKKQQWRMPLQRFAQPAEKPMVLQSFQGGPRVAPSQPEVSLIGEAGGGRSCGNYARQAEISEMRKKGRRQ